MPAQSVTDSRPRKRCPLLSPVETWTENFESRQATRKHFYNNWLFTLSSHKKSKPTSSVLLFSNTQVFVFEDQVVLCKCLLVSSTVCVATNHWLVIATPTVVSSKNRRANYSVRQLQRFWYIVSFDKRCSTSQLLTSISPTRWQSWI